MRFKLSLRKKLFLVSLLILLVPWIGVRYIQAIEDYLQQLVLENLSSYTQSVATAMSSHAEYIPNFPSGEALYALPLAKAPDVDGYDNDWDDFQDYRSRIGGDRAGPSFLIGRFEQSIYLHLTIQDKSIRYYQDSMPLRGVTSSDAVLLTLKGMQGISNLIIVTEAPGAVSARDIKSGKRESRVQGNWRERDNGAGYQLELKLPLSYVTDGMNLAVRNLGQEEQFNHQLNKQSIPVLSAPDYLQERIAQFGIIDGRRLWLLDTDGRVLVNKGSLTITRDLAPINPLFALLLAPEAISDPWQGRTRFERDDIQQALNGQNITTRLSIQQGRGLLLSSAWPIEKDGQIVAAILIEESTAAIQIMQRSALADLLNLSLIIFLLLSIALIGFAGRLGSRIRRLKKMTDQAIDQQGRVQGEIPQPQSGDEIDELSNHIRDMLIRLRDYHDYLEKLASRLSHEIRTPVAVVRSSLENMHLDESDVEKDNRESLARANQGVQRLQTLLLRMSEASRLEHSIDDASIKRFDLNEFLNMITQGYRDIYPEHQFELNCDDSDIAASKDLLAQCLDKLVSNAVSFAEPGTVVSIDAKFKNGWKLSVTNQGPQLPQGMEQQLFQSMVSIREKAHKGDVPHLGLGLHIVRLIAEFHQGSVKAENTHQGVRFTMNLR